MKIIIDTTKVALLTAIARAFAGVGIAVTRILGSAGTSHTVRLDPVGTRGHLASQLEPFVTCAQRCERRW